MKTLKELNPVTRKWQSNMVDCVWLKSGKLDNGQKTLVHLSDQSDKYVLLTENDLHFMPTQEMLKEYIFYAKPEVYEKLFKPYFEVRKLKKDKVVKTKLNLRIV